jgi:hypothetical protein
MVEARKRLSKGKPANSKMGETKDLFQIDLSTTTLALERRRFIAIIAGLGAGSMFGMVPISVCAANANALPSFTKEQAHAVALTVNAICQLNVVEKSHIVFLADAFREYLAQNPEATAQNALDVAIKLKSHLIADLQDAKHRGINLTTQFDIASIAFKSFAKASILTPEQLHKIATGWYDFGQEATQPSEQIWASLNVQTLFANSLTSFNDYRLRVVKQIYDKAESLPGAVDHIFRDVVGGISVASHVDDIVSAIPIHEKATKLIEVLRNPGPIQLTAGDCQLAVAQATAQINVGLGRGISLLKTISLQQVNITDAIPHLGKELLDNVRDYMDKGAVDISEVIGTGNLAGTIANLISPGLGNRLISYSNAVINVGQTIAGLVSKASALTTLGELGSAFLSGGLTTALSGFAQAFGGGGGNAAEIALLTDIKNQLGEIKKDIATLQSQMNQRFDQLDRKLDRYYAALSTQLEQIQETSNQIIGSLADIKAQMFDVQAELAHLEGEIRAQFLSYTDSSLTLLIGRALDDKDSSAADNFVHDLRDLTTYATILAANRGNASPSNTPSYKVDNAKIELSGTLAANIGYLSAFIVENQISAQGLSTRPLANYDMWSLAARATIQLLVDCPKNAKETGAVEKLLAIRATGNIAADASRQVSRKDGDESKKCNALFQWLFARYRERTAMLRRAVDTDYKQFKTALNPSQTQHILGINIFGSAEQSTTYDPAFDHIVPDDDPYFSADGDVDTSQVGSLPLSKPFNAPRVYRLYALLNNLPMLNLTFGELDWGSTKLSCKTTYPEGTDLRFIYISDARKPSFVTYFRIGKYVFNYATIEGTEVADAQLYLYKQSAYADAPSDCKIRGDVVKSTDLVAWTKANWNGGNGWKVFDLGVGMADTAHPQLSTMLDELTAKLKESSTIFVTQTLPDSLLSGELSRAATRLDAVVALIKEYCALGFSKSLECDDEMRALLFGSQSIVGTAELSQILMDVQKMTADGTQGLNPLSLFGDIADKRINLLEERLDTAMRRIWNGQSSEIVRCIDSTLALIDTYVVGRG